MVGNTIFTIGRQYGSAGRRVGSELAKQLNIPFYDKELITLVAKDSGLNEAIVEKADEKPATEEKGAEKPTEATPAKADEEKPAGEGKDEKPEPAEEKPAEKKEEKPEEKVEKVQLAKSEREKLRTQAAEALTRANELQELLEATEEAPEGKPAEEKPAEKKAEKVEVEMKVDAETLSKLTELVKELVGVNEKLAEENETLKEAVKKIPAKRALITHAQFAPAKKDEKAEKKPKAKAAEAVEPGAAVKSLFENAGLGGLLKQ